MLERKGAEKGWYTKVYQGIPIKNMKKEKPIKVKVKWWKLILFLSGFLLGTYFIVRFLMKLS